tara:strand:- start:5995 stop:6432 length:438 start_codon:yes stop_codon:yes gene_type:complete
MALHSFTGVTASIRTSGATTGALVGYVSGDFTLAAATGKYTELGSSYATANTRGLKSVTGSLSAAWGLKGEELQSMLTNDEEFEIRFAAAGTQAVATTSGTEVFTLSNCVLTDLAIEGMEAGAEGPLLINASFEGLSWSFTAADS